MDDPTTEQLRELRSLMADAPGTVVCGIHTTMGGVSRLRVGSGSDSTSSWVANRLDQSGWTYSGRVSGTDRLRIFVFPPVQTADDLVDDLATTAFVLGTLLLVAAMAWVATAGLVLPWHLSPDTASCAGVLPMGPLAARLMSGSITGRPVNDHAWLTHESITDAISAPLGRERSSVLWFYADECDSVRARGVAIDLRSCAVEPCEMYTSPIGPDLGPIRTHAMAYVEAYCGVGTGTSAWSDEDLGVALLEATLDWATGRSVGIATLYAEHLSKLALQAEESDAWRSTTPSPRSVDPAPCAVCGRPAAYVLTSPTDACPSAAGTLYCSACSASTASTFEPMSGLDV